LISSLLAVGAYFYFKQQGSLGLEMSIVYSLAGSASLFLLWVLIIKWIAATFVRPSLLRNLDNLTELNGQSRKDSWNNIKDILHQYLSGQKKLLKVGFYKKELESLRSVYQRGAREIRQAINDLPRSNL
jgi:hypothetical protein